MGNCISKINKDRLLDLEEFMKNKTSFEKGKARPGIDRLTGGTYMRIHSIKGLSRKTLTPLQTGVVEKPYLNGLPWPHENIFYVILRHFLFCISSRTMQHQIK